MKKLVSIILCLIMLFTLTSCGKVKRVEPLVWGFSNHNINNYEKKREKIEYASDYLPPLDELNGYADISYSYQYTYMLVFEVYSFAIFLEYPADIYEKKKLEVLSSYDFLEETIISKDGQSYQSPPAKFEYGEYILQTSVNSNVGSYNNSFCKSFAFIGVNDNKNRIVYCYTYDFDLDTFGSIERYESEQDMITQYIDDFYDWNDLP